MKNDLPTSGSTRRSFIKRSVVAAVAVSTMTIFSGLVNAGPTDYAPAPPECTMTREQIYDTVNGKKVYGHDICWYENADDSCVNRRREPCGTSADRNEAAMVININCRDNKTKNTGMICVQTYTV